MLVVDGYFANIVKNSDATEVNLTCTGNWYLTDNDNTVDLSGGNVIDAADSNIVDLTDNDTTGDITDSSIIDFADGNTNLSYER